MIRIACCLVLTAAAALMPARAALALSSVEGLAPSSVEGAQGSVTIFGSVTDSAGSLQVIQLTLKYSF